MINQSKFYQAFPVQSMHANASKQGKIWWIFRGTFFLVLWWIFEGHRLWCIVQVWLFGLSRAIDTPVPDKGEERYDLCDMIIPSMTFTPVLSPAKLWAWVCMWPWQCMWQCLLSVCFYITECSSPETVSSDTYCLCPVCVAWMNSHCS